MPRVDSLILRSPVKSSFRVEQIRGMFDVPNREEIVHEWSADLPVEDLDWKIGLIVGASGSGKTVLSRELFPDAHYHDGFEWSDEGAVVDSFPGDLDGKAITGALSSVGFSSPPQWLKRFSHLSNGQKFRCELARCLLLDVDTVIFDEFTSVVDRGVAKICSAAVSKAIKRRQRPRFIALSCHYDIIDWLCPDWVYDVTADRFESRSLQRRHPIKLEIHEASRGVWPLFRGHHYLSADLLKTAKCFVAMVDGQPAAFLATIHHYGAVTGRREHRLVTLPDYQGVGIGNALSEWMGARLFAEGVRYYSVTSSPAMVAHRLRSPKWALTRSGTRAARKNEGWGRTETSSRMRLTRAFVFVGDSIASDSLASENASA